MDKWLEINLKVWGKTYDELQHMSYGEIIKMCNSSLALYKIMSQITNVDTLKDYIKDNKLNLTKAGLKRLSDEDKNYFTETKKTLAERIAEVSEKLVNQDIGANERRRER